MRRRTLLAALASAGTLMTGCLGNGSSDPNNRSTPTQTLSPAETPVPFPETCEPLPDIDDLPAPPSELTEESVVTFVRDFERVYAVATNDEFGGVGSLDIRSVGTMGDRYIVSLSFDANPATPTPDADGMTPTQHPPDAYTHRAVYRVTDDQMLRELRSHIDNSLLSSTCWTLETG